MPILFGSQQDLWLAGRSERPHKVAGSWPDGLHVASSCNSRAVLCLIRACSVPEGRVTWDQHEGEGRNARYIRVDNAPASCFRDPRFMSGHRNGLCWIFLFMVALTSSKQMLVCCVRFDPERLFMRPSKYVFLNNRSSIWCFWKVDRALTVRVYPIHMLVDIFWDEFQDSSFLNTRLRFKPKGHGFDFRWVYWDSSLT
jgi:hypothetical protein